MPIPVLNEKQMGDLRGMLNQRKVIDLTGNQNAKATRLPQMPEEEKEQELPDLSVSVENGTASISLTGSTETVDFVQGENVEITGNTNEEGKVSVVLGTTCATGIEASVLDNTASITLTGGTGSVNIVGTGSVLIRKNNTTGKIEINTTGGSGSINFPDYATSPVKLSDSVVYPGDGSIQSDMWLIGTVGLYKTSSSGWPSYVDLDILSTDGTTVVRTMNLFADTGAFSGVYEGNNFLFSVTRPIPAGYRVKVRKSGSASFNLYLYYT